LHIVVNAGQHQFNLKSLLKPSKQMPKIKSQLIAIRLAGLTAVAIGIYIPIAKTSSGLSYILVGTNVWLINILLAVIALLAIFSNDIPESISKKTTWISVFVLAVICIYDIFILKDGLIHFLFQTAGNMASNPNVNKDQYWGTLYALSGITDQSHQLYGLRNLYDQYGGALTPFWDVINALSNDDARKLTSLSGGGYLVFPMGAALIFIGTLVYTFPGRLSGWVKARFPTVFPD
jgi:hypothetical protein